MKKPIKKLPSSELEIMIIIWNSKEILTRTDIEKSLKRKLAPTTVLSFLSRLEEKGFIKTEREGKTKYFYPIIDESSYLEYEANLFLSKFNGNSVKNFISTLINGNNLNKDELDELKNYLIRKTSGEK